MVTQALTVHIAQQNKHILPTSTYADHLVGHTLAPPTAKCFNANRKIDTIKYDVKRCIYTLTAPAACIMYSNICAPASRMQADQTRVRRILYVWHCIYLCTPDCQHKFFAHSTDTQTRTHMRTRVSPCNVLAGDIHIALICNANVIQCRFFFNVSHSTHGVHLCVLLILVVYAMAEFRWWRVHICFELKFQNITLVTPVYIK